MLKYKIIELHIEDVMAYSNAALLQILPFYLLAKGFLKSVNSWQSCRKILDCLIRRIHLALWRLKTQNESDNFCVTDRNSYYTVSKNKTPNS